MARDHPLGIAGGIKYAEEYVGTVHKPSVPRGEEVRGLEVSFGYVEEEDDVLLKDVYGRARAETAK